MGNSAIRAADRYAWEFSALGLILFYGLVHVKSVRPGFGWALICWGVVWLAAAYAREVSNVSYPIYLARPFGLRAWHHSFERLVGTASFLSLTTYVLSAVVVGLGVGIASYLFVEKRILDGLKRPTPSLR